MNIIILRVLALCSWVCVHEEIPICGTMTNHRHSCCTQAPSPPHPAVLANYPKMSLCDRHYMNQIASKTTSIKHQFFTLNSAISYTLRSCMIQWIYGGEAISTDLQQLEALATS